MKNKNIWMSPAESPSRLNEVWDRDEEPKREVTGVDDNRPKPNYCYAKEQGHGEIGCVFPACHCGLPIKEEPKQYTSEELKGFEDFKKMIKPKQETLEEAAERLYPENWESIMEGKHDTNSYERNSFIKGAKYQAKMMYSLEEVINIQKEWNDFNEEQNSFNGQDDLTFEEWFAKFKKK
jgi:hypothetical protein